MGLLHKTGKFTVMGVTIMSVIVMAAALSGIPAYAASRPAEIKDIADSSDFAMQAIHDLAYKGVISGDADGDFHPQAEITRAETTKILVSVLGLDTAAVPAIPTFLDVPKDNWAYGYVEAAYQAGIVNGVAPGLFDPDGKCTREQLAKMFVGSLSLGEGAFDLSAAADSGLTAFKDCANISDWAMSSVKVAVCTGIMQGAGEDFLPGDNATKEQTAVIAYRFIQKKTAVQEELDAIANTQVTGTPNGFDFVFSEPTNGFDILSVWYVVQGNDLAVKHYDGSGQITNCFFITYGSSDRSTGEADYQPLSALSPKLVPGETYHVKFAFSYKSGDTKTIYCEKAVTILPRAPHVLGAVPLNANQIEVRFSDSVTTASAEDSGNYTIAGANGAPVQIKSFEPENLGEDTHSVILNLAETIASREKLNVSVTDGIQRFSDSKAFPAYSCSIIMNDRKAPDIEKADWSDDGTDFTSVTLYFSEPVSSGTVMIDNEPSGTANGERTTISGLKLDGSASHSVYVANISDGVNMAQNTALAGKARLYDPPKTDTIPPAVESTSFTRDASGRVATISITYGEQLLPSVPTGHIDAYDGSGAPVNVMQWVTDENGNRTGGSYDIFCYSTGLPADGRTVVLTIADGVNIFSGKYSIRLPAGLVTDTQYNDSAAESITVDF